MTKNFNYTFTYYGREITISKAVTDKMDDRNQFKKTWAVKWMTDTLRAYTGDRYMLVDIRKTTEVKRSEMVKLADTLKAMENAKAYFKSLTREQVIEQFGC